MYSSPAISADGKTIYVGSFNKHLYAVNANTVGTGKWIFNTGGAVVSSPAVGVDGTIYVGAAAPDGKLYAIDPDGHQAWTFQTKSSVTSTPGVGSVNSPAIGADRIIYVGAGAPDGKLYAIDPDSHQANWTVQIGRGVRSSPAISADDQTIYVGSSRSYLYSPLPDDLNLYAINHDGSKKWSFPLSPPTFIGQDLFSSPAIGADGTIYIGLSGYGSKFYAIIDGGPGVAIPKWAFSIRYGTGSAAIGADGTIYVVSDGAIYALTDDISHGCAPCVKWVTSEGNASSSPAIGADGTIYVGSEDGKVLAFRQQ